jgi:CubicO group peptidase (beta-lactamase class C family)
MRTRTLAILFLASWAASSARAKDPVPAPADPELAAAIDEAVLVAREGKVLFAKGYGASDYASRPNAPDTLFEIASTSKQFTAAAVLRLEQQKKLKLTDTLDRFFRDLPEDKHAVTVEHLLHHTAGLAPDLGVPYSWTGGRGQYVEQMLGRPLVAEPGKAFDYSNVGYALLAAIVEEVSGRSFEDYVRKELFAPAGLGDTGFVRDPKLVKSERIAARRCDDCQPGWTAADWWWGWGYRGMGGVVTTALDLLKWDRALRGDKVLGDAAKERLYAPGLGGYGCGWFVETTERGTTRVHHSGGVRGFATAYARWLEEDVVVVVLSNGRSDVHRVQEAVASKLFAPARVVADLDPGDLPMSQYGAVVLDTGASWALDRERGQPRLRLVVGRHDLATFRFPKPLAKKLVADLEAALGQSTFPDPDAAPAMEAGLYLGMLGGARKRVHLEEDVSIRVMPSYRGQGADGKPVVDPRAVLILDAPKAGGWPVMVRMNPGAVRALLETLRDA